MVATQRMMATRVGAQCLDRVGLFTEWLTAVRGGKSAHDGHPCRRPVPGPGWFVYRVVQSNVASSGAVWCPPETCRRAPQPAPPCLLMCCVLVLSRAYMRLLIVLIAVVAPGIVRVINAA